MKLNKEEIEIMKCALNVYRETLSIELKNIKTSAIRQKFESGIRQATDLHAKIIVEG